MGPLMSDRAGQQIPSAPGRLAFVVTDGVITASKDQAIWTVRDYDNFVLDLEFKTAAGTNSGVLVYCGDTRNWIPNSVEIQIADDYAQKWARAPKTWHCGAVFGHLAGTVERAVPTLRTT